MSSIRCRLFNKKNTNLMEKWSTQRKQKPWNLRNLWRRSSSAAFHQTLLRIRLESTFMHLERCVKMIFRIPKDFEQIFLSLQYGLHMECIVYWLKFISLDGLIIFTFNLMTIIVVSAVRWSLLSCQWRTKQIKGEDSVLLPSVRRNQ